MVQFILSDNISLVLIEMISFVIVILTISKIKCLDVSMIRNGDITLIYQNSQLNYKFNRTTFQSSMNCENGQLTIVQLQKGSIDKIGFQFRNSPISQPLILSRVSKDSFYPIIYEVTNNSFILDPNCPLQINSNNYYNQIIITLTSLDQSQSYQWAFLLDCEADKRHKKFQIGYLIIAFINAAITIGVALHSRVWSIRFKGGSIHLVLTWKVFVLIMVIITGAGVAFYFYARSVFADANYLLRIIGIVIGAFFVFLCSDQIFYLFNPFRKPIYSFIRSCDVVSLFITILVVIMASLVDNWIVANFLAICICVGSIKLLKFRTLQQSIVCMAIYAALVTGLAVVFHYTLARSYNDYASQLSSPFFILIPDLVDNLYKKCSWLPVFDIIVPGVMLAYLRSYDVNYSTSAVWGGVYTVIGNVSFLLATIIWILIQAVYPFSVPFCLVSYPILCLSILLLAYKRNQLKTLWCGFFNMSRQSEIILIDQNPKTFDELISQQVKEQIKYRQTISDYDINEQKQQIQQK